MGNYRDGTDLILSINTHALGHSTECKISYKAETGTRKTKEQAAGKWSEKYVKSLGCTITASGFVHEDDDNNSIDTLRTAFKNATPVDASWGYRDGSGIDSGKFIITSLDHEGKAGDDETYSITLENSGAVGAAQAQG
jgi:predicted secreted protein